jgi:hypothetical protein
VIVGTAVATAMDLGAGIVDMAKFGPGAASGTVGGFTKDAVRLIGIMGPLGKAAKFVQVSSNAKLARLIVGTGAQGAAGYRGLKLFVKPVPEHSLPWRIWQKRWERSCPSWA